MTKVVNPITKEIMSVGGKEFFYITDPSGDRHKYPIAGNEFKPEGKAEVAQIVKPVVEPPKEPMIPQEIIVKQPVTKTPIKSKKRVKKQTVPIETPQAKPPIPQKNEEREWWF